MRIMVKVGSSGNHPIDEPSFNQRNESRDAQTGRRQGTRKSHTYGDILSQHLSRVKLASLAQARRIVCDKHLLDEVGDLDFLVDRLRVNSLARKKLGRLGHQTFMSRRSLDGRGYEDLRSLKR